MQCKKALSKEELSTNLPLAHCVHAPHGLFSTLFPIQQLNRLVSENKVTENSTEPHLGVLRIPPFPKHLGNPEACFFLAFLHKHSASAFCWAIPSLFLSSTPHLSLQSMCSLSPLWSTGQGGILQPSTFLKQLLQGPTHRYRLSWFLTQETEAQGK